MCENLLFDEEILVRWSFLGGVLLLIGCTIE